jgi:hypothetical protein
LCCVKCWNTPSKCSLSSQCCLKLPEVVNYGLEITKVSAPGLLRYVHICTQNTRFYPKETTKLVTSNDDLKISRQDPFYQVSLSRRGDKI